MLPVLRIIGLLRILLMLFAGPYRVVAHKPGSFGGFGMGLVTWIGVAAVYPVFAFPTVPPSARLGATGLWVALVVFTYAQMFATWLAAKPHDPYQVPGWFGRADAFFAIALLLAVMWLAGNGAGMFFVVGSLCNTVQLWLIVLRHRLEDWTPQDTARIIATLNAGRNRSVALADWTKQTAPKAGRFALAKALIACTFTGARRSGPPVQAWRRRAAARAASTAPAAPPTFMGRVGSFLVGHAIWVIVFEGLGLAVVFKVVGLILAAILMILGWRVEAPEDVKDEAQVIVSGARDHWQYGKQEALDDWNQHKAEISDEAGRAGRKAAWYYFTR